MRAAASRHTPLRVACLVTVAAIMAHVFFIAEPYAGLQLLRFVSDKLLHVVFYGGLAFLLWVGTSGRWPIAVRVLVVLIGAAHEAHQAAYPGRTPDFQDWLADGFGAAAALFVLQRKYPAPGLAVHARALSRTGG